MLAVVNPDPNLLVARWNQDRAEPSGKWLFFHVRVKQNTFAEHTFAIGCQNDPFVREMVPTFVLVPDRN